MKKKMMSGLVCAMALTMVLGGCSGNTEQKTGEGSATNSGESTVTDSSTPYEEIPKVTVTLNGEDYILPMSFQDFAAKGWTYFEPEQADLASWPGGLQPGGGTGAGFYFSNGEIKALGVFLTNRTDEFQPFVNCEVNGFYVDRERQIGGQDPNLFIQYPAGSMALDGLVLGEATIEDFVDKFGTDKTMEYNPQWKLSEMNALMYYLGGTTGDDLHVGFDEEGHFNEFQYKVNH